MTAVVVFCIGLLLLGAMVGAAGYRWAWNRTVDAVLADSAWAWPDRPDGRRAR